MSFDITKRSQNASGEKALNDDSWIPPLFWDGVYEATRRPHSIPAREFSYELVVRSIPSRGLHHECESSP